MVDARLHGWDPAWIADLIDISSPAELDSRIVEALRVHGPCLAAALWRRELCGLHWRWQPAAAAGPDWALPESARVRAVLDGGLDEALLSGARVVRVGGPTGYSVAVILPLDTARDVDEMAEALLVLEHVLRESIAPGDAA